MKQFRRFAPLLLILLAGCDRGTPSASGLLAVPMTIGSKTYTLEIAAKTLDRNKGLMYRDAMPEDHGMIFVFAKAVPQSFWMHNTRIPLDILYLDSAGRVVSIHRMEAYSEKGTRSKAPAQYAVELNDGQAAACGVKEGDVLKLPGAVGAPGGAVGDP